MKILCYAEAPIETGAGQISKQLLPLLASMGDLEVVPINLNKDMVIDTVKYPYTFYRSEPSANIEDQFNLKNAQKHILEDAYDLLFLTGDINRIADCIDSVEQARWQGKEFTTVCLGAIDSAVINAASVKCLWQVDHPVVYSQYAYDQAIKFIPALAKKLKVIQLGCEPDVFYPLTKDEKRQVRDFTFRITDDSTFFVTCFNRNQLRKDLARSMYAFHLFHEKHENSIMYVHARQEDLGGSLTQQAILLGIPLSTIIFTPPGYNEVAGMPRETLNKFYNAGDVCISTSTGEGWGLTTTEAMAAGTPFIGPRNSSFPEILGENEERGYMVQSGGPNLWMMPYGVMNQPKDLVSVTDMVGTLEHVYNNRQEAYAKAGAARTWTEEHKWSHMNAQWSALLTPIMS
jgi:glycosyltransferase involved in cell wall biosynthesis